MTPGDKLGPYEILALIGAGGMGEVYRAKDTNLKRDVALKVLPASFAGDPERLARFQREAEVLASLNHPNIAAIYGVEERALVMEFVEGESPKGPMPFDDAWAICTQIADALEYAHDKGVIHRDLKPANVKVTPEGKVKLLDFGLAKAMSAQREPSANPENSPTLTMGATEAGMILGTAAYMAPEQARGKGVDKRADIWSFGVVLYELLTGERMFQGEDAAETLAAVIHKQPDFTKVPAQARTLMEACLEKDPKKRLKDIGDAQRLLSRQVSAAPVSSRPHAVWIASAIAAVILLVVATSLAVAHFREAPPAQQTLRLQMTLPGDVPTRNVALSPDGSLLALLSTSGNGPGQLWIRSMGSGEAKPVPGADAVTYIFWSPDNANIGFFSQGKLKKIAMSGGPPQTLCDVATARGGTWNRDGVILFSPGPTSAIYRVSAAGGTPVAVTKLESQGEGHRFPEFLPDGKHFLFAVGSVNLNRTGIYVGSLDGEAPVRLLPDISNAMFAASQTKQGEGYILFRRDVALMALPFDLTRLKAAGDVSPIAGEVQGGLNNGFGVFSASANGLLVFLPGRNADSQSVWVDRSGKRSSMAVAKGAPPGDPGRLSPDGSILAERVVSPGGQGDIWLVDFARNVSTRFTFRSGNVRHPAWSPDGSRIAYGFTPTNGYEYDLVIKPTSGTGKEETLLPGGVNTWPTDWSPDGKFILYQQTGRNTAIDLMLLPVDGSPGNAGPPKPIPFAQSPFDETEGRFSPDGKWIAYMSNESGENRIYLQNFPATGAKYQVSMAGGSYPAWRRDGKEIYYLAEGGKVMAVPVKLGASVELGTPQALFADPTIGNFVPAPDGQRFLVNVPSGNQTATALLTVVTGWQSVLKK
jgi:serine/threonine protein kinase